MVINRYLIGLTLHPQKNMYQIIEKHRRPELQNSSCRFRPTCKVVLAYLIYGQITLSATWTAYGSITPDCPLEIPQPVALLRRKNKTTESLKLVSKTQDVIGSANPKWHRSFFPEPLRSVKYHHRLQNRPPLLLPFQKELLHHREKRGSRKTNQSFPLLKY